MATFFLADFFIAMIDYGTVLQAALTPITLISGVGLLLVSMTNRYNHSTDRLRQLLRESDAIKPRKDDDLDHAIELIFLRVRLLRKAILLIVLSGMFSALLVLRFHGAQIHFAFDCYRDGCGIHTYFCQRSRHFHESAGLERSPLKEQEHG